LASRASLVALQLRTHLQCRRHRFSPWVGKIPLEKEMATYSSILAWEIPWTWWAIVYGVARVGHDLVTKPPPPPPGL